MDRQPAGQAELISEARSAREKAYSPYSGFLVGAALLAADGRIFLGCNIENASYGMSMCAERVAIYKAVSEGVREFARLAVVADSPEPVTPCGACRQVMAEFSPDMEVIMANVAGDARCCRLDELLPAGFTAAQMTHRQSGGIRKND